MDELRFPVDCTEFLTVFYGSVLVLHARTPTSATSNVASAGIRDSEEAVPTKYCVFVGTNYMHMRIVSTLHGLAGKGVVFRAVLYRCPGAMSARVCL